MGDPKKQRKKYSRPGHPWQRARMESESVLKRTYGLKNKTEIWKVSSLMKRFASDAKRLLTADSKHAELERKQILAKLTKLGLISAGTSIENVLTLKTEDFMNRRLQTIVFKKGLARSEKQARQFVVHGHIQVAGKKITSPSYLVSLDEERTISFVNKSAFIDESHPERIQLEKVVATNMPKDTGRDVVKESEAVIEATETVEEKPKKTAKKAAKKE